VRGLAEALGPQLARGRSGSQAVAPCAVIAPRALSSSWVLRVRTRGKNTAHRSINLRACLTRLGEPGDHASPWGAHEHVDQVEISSKRVMIDRYRDRMHDMHAHVHANVCTAGRRPAIEANFYERDCIMRATQVYTCTRACAHARMQCARGRARARLAYGYYMRSNPLRR